MFRILSLIAFAGLLFTRCGSNSSGNENNPTHDSLAVSIDSSKGDVIPFTINIDPALLTAVTPEQKKILVFMYGEKNAVSMMSAMAASKNVKTDLDCFRLFSFVDSLCNAVTDYMNSEDAPVVYTSMVDSLLELSKKTETLVPYFHFTCEAECTMPVVQLDYMKFLTLSQKTTGKTDDDYFELLKFVFHGYITNNTMLTVWFEGTWDYGGNSLLGEGKHFETLQRCEKIKPNSPFAKYIEGVETICLNDALEYGNFKYTAEKAIAELKKIMAMLEIGKKRKKDFEKRLEDLQHPAPGTNMQFDCEHNDCQYG